MLVSNYYWTEQVPWPGVRRLSLAVSCFRATNGGWVGGDGEPSRRLLNIGSIYLAPSALLNTSLTPL